MPSLRLHLIRLAAATAATATVALGCTTETAGDPRPGPRTQTIGPSIPDKPHLDAEDYSYTLQLLCQCEHSSEPVRVLVEDGRAVQATFLQDGRRHDAGEITDDASFLVTINDIIDAVNDDTVFAVSIDWPDGQDWPNRVNVDPVEMTADEEYGYRIAEVVIAR